MAESLPYASPRPPRRSDAAVLSAWCAFVGILPIFAGIVLHVLSVRFPRWIEPFVPTTILLALAAITIGLVCAIQSIVQREPRWRLAAVAGGACAATLAWVAFTFVMG